MYQKRVNNFQLEIKNQTKETYIFKQKMTRRFLYVPSHVMSQSCIIQICVVEIFVSDVVRVPTSEI